MRAPVPACMPGRVTLFRASQINIFYSSIIIEEIKVKCLNINIIDTKI